MGQSWATTWLLLLAFGLPAGCAPERPQLPKEEAVKVFRKELTRRVNEGQRLWSDLHQLMLKQGVSSPQLAPKIQQLKGDLSAHYLWLQENAAQLNGQYPGALPTPVQQHAVNYFSARVQSASIMERFLTRPDDKVKFEFEQATRQADRHFRALESALGNRTTPIVPAAGVAAYTASRDGQSLKAVLARVPGISRAVVDPKDGVIAYTRPATAEAAKPIVEAATKAIHQAFQNKRRDIRVGFRAANNHKLYDVFILTNPKQQLSKLKGSHALSVMGTYQAVIQEHAPPKAAAAPPRQVSPRRTRMQPQQRHYVPRRPVRRYR